MSYQNFCEFYQKALIPIGSNDLTSLKNSEFNQSDLPSFTTHWLIALEGVLSSNPNEFYNWKVNIYPSDAEGAFIWNKAFYSSPMIDSFDKAIELARTFESYSKNDQLLSTNLHVKIC